MQLRATLRFAFAVCALLAAVGCTSGSSAPADGGAARDGGALPDGGTAQDGGPPLDAGIPCNQQPLGPSTCGIGGGNECPRGQVCTQSSCTASGTARPSARSDHATVYDPSRNRVVLFGGDTRGTVNDLEQPQLSDETWSFDLATLRWEQLTPVSAPEARGGFAGVLVRDDQGRGRWIVFGGRSGNFGALRLHNDVWSYDLTTDQWLQLAQDVPKHIDPNVPEQRHRSAVSYDAARGRILVFGGNADPDRFANRTLNDLWAFDLTQRTWSEVAQSSPWPTPRSDFGADVDESGGRWYLFGGAADAQNRIDEVWRFDFAAGTWESLNTTGAPAHPEFARHGAKLAYIPVNDRLYVFGGRTGTALARRNDLWRLELNTRAWVEIQSGDTQIRTPACTAPERRDEHTLVAVPGQRRLVLVGGEADCGILDDLWLYNLDGNSWSNPYVATRGESCERVAPACFGPCPGP